ncbi:MAG: hypothetical protein CVV21_01080 [Candidatus Goldiibacteriota bacterium HGW-Goldbacteria-1]|jgi:hypothetical protein|nr:MAG: hypothetical protein CVV21_01080 [Candidatus Goldiibacteriota bacterium HGW-Goldbacteria-1]
MTAVRLYKIAQTAQIFMKIRPMIKERQEVYDEICTLAHKIRPYKESEGIRRIAPGFFKYTAKKYIFDFEDTNDGYITIAKISYIEKA